jgi:protein-tyrosine phosphatase
VSDSDARTTSTTRTLVFEGAFNARDLGGLTTGDGRRVRTRRIFRSANLQRLTEADVALIHELGLRTVCDLRSDEEQDWTGPGPLLERGKIAHAHHPFFDQTTGHSELHPDDPELRQRLWLERGYERMLEISGAAIADIFRLLAREDAYPLLFHCAAGKDRTGVLSALILRTLGVSDADIIDDYTLSAAQRPSFEVLRAFLADYGVVIDDVSDWDPWQAPPEVMTSTLRILDERWGSDTHYLKAHGVSDAEIAALRNHMLEQ